MPWKGQSTSGAAGQTPVVGRAGDAACRATIAGFPWGASGRGSRAPWAVGQKPDVVAARATAWGASGGVDGGPPMETGGHRETRRENPATAGGRWARAPRCRAGSSGAWSSWELLARASVARRLHTHRASRQRRKSQAAEIKSTRCCGYRCPRLRTGVATQSAYAGYTEQAAVVLAGTTTRYAHSGSAAFDLAGRAAGSSPGNQKGTIRACGREVRRRPASPLMEAGHQLSLEDRARRLRRAPGFRCSPGSSSTDGKALRGRRVLIDSHWAKVK